MKIVMKTALSLLLALCLLVGMVPAVAAFWDFSQGVPADWERQDTLEEITAEHLLNPVNPHASQESKNLLAYIQLVGDSQQCIGGQFDISNNNGAYNEVIREYGYEPTLYSARYKVDDTEPVWEVDGNGRETTILLNSCMDYPDIDRINKLMLDHYNNGNILLIHSDGTVPDLCGQMAMKNKPMEYPDVTGAIIELDATNPDRDMQAYTLWIKFQTNLIEGLKKMEAMGVKAYLWRPWVEYNNPFGGYSREAYEAFARVYQQTIHMMVEAELTGFLVTYSPCSWTNILTHHPGTEYIDIYGFTMYSNPEELGMVPGSRMNANSYAAVKRSGKPMGFTEWSCRTGEWRIVGDQARSSSLDLLYASLSYWPELAFFDYWGAGPYDTSNDNGDKSGNDDGMLFWGSDFVITLDEAIDYRQGIIRSPGIAQLFTTKEISEEYVGLEERSYTADELKTMGITADDVRAVRLNQGFYVTFWTEAQCTGDYYRYASSQMNIPAEVAKNFRSVSIERLDNVALDQSEIYASVNDAGAWRINDGNFSTWEGDVYAQNNEAQAGTAWIYLDLGKAYQVSRFVLKNASYAGRADVYNTVDFQVQYSQNGTAWVTVSEIKDNTLGQVDRSFTPVMAQYFRLLITKPNRSPVESEKGVAVVAEWELYGVDPGKAYVEPTPTTTTKKPTTTTKKVTTTTKKTTKKTTTTTALKLATPKVTVSNATKGVKVSWGKVSKADKYYVYRKTGSGSWSKIKTTTSVSYTDESAKAGKSYQYMVKAVKGSVTSGYKAVSITRLTAPATKVANASKGVKVSWGKVTGASKYTVYRKTGSGSWSKIKTTTSTSYTDTKASAGKNYQYMVKAVKGDYTSYYKAASIRRLKAPSSVKLAKATKGFKVSWSKVTGATKYEVYRKTGNGSYTKIATTTKTAYTDKTAKKGKYYTYRVRAVYSSYKSEFKTGSKTKR